MVKKPAKKKASKKTSSGATLSPQPEQLLTADDILRGGEDPYTPLEIPELRKGGQPGVVYLKQLDAGDVIDFMDEDEEKRNQAILELITKAVVNRDGERIFEGKAEQLRKIPIGAFGRLSRAVTDMATVALEESVGND